MTAPAPASTRQTILNVAERLFAERGFAGVSMRDISAECDFKNQASLYNHFPSKRALYEAVLTRALEGLMGGGPPSFDREDVASGVDRVVDYLAEHPHLPLLIQRAVLDGSEALDRMLKTLILPLYGRGRQTLTQLRVGWSEEELDHLAAGLYHLLFGYFVSARLLSAVGISPLSPQAIATQKQFLRKAFARLLNPHYEMEAPQ